MCGPLVDILRRKYTSNTTLYEEDTHKQLSKKKKRDNEVVAIAIPYIILNNNARME